LPVATAPPGFKTLVHPNPSAVAATRKGRGLCDGHLVPGKRILRLPLPVRLSLGGGHNFVFFLFESRTHARASVRTRPKRPLSMCYCACGALRGELGMGAFQYKSQPASERAMAG